MSELPTFSGLIEVNIISYQIAETTVGVIATTFEFIYADGLRKVFEISYEPNGKMLEVVQDELEVLRRMIRRNRS